MTLSTVGLGLLVFGGLHVPGTATGVPWVPLGVLALGLGFLGVLCKPTRPAQLPSPGGAAEPRRSRRSRRPRPERSTTCHSSQSRSPTVAPTVWLPAVARGPMSATPLLLTVAQLAAYLDVPAAEVWRAWRAGDGPRAVERCGLPRWRTADVDAWLAAGSRRSRDCGTVRGKDVAGRTAP